ncbi:MAG: hypothetical protein JW801_17650 [Bacteroidales bacterium]|nr:hypothetical protein [Bacteroidales bacterium]
MDVKGIAIKTTRDFVKANFPNDYSKWLNELPSATRANYESMVDVSKWYPLEDCYLIPINRIARLFYQGNERTCGEAMGTYSADIALKGIYKVFLLIASPKFLMQRATKIITTYYQPSQVEAESVSDKEAIIRVTEFKSMDNILEYRFAGWCKRALELSNCSGVNYQIRKSIAKGDSCTEIVFSWN